MAISDLTGTKWLFNNVITTMPGGYDLYGVSGYQETYAIDFISEKWPNINNKTLAFGDDDALDGRPGIIYSPSTGHEGDASWHYSDGYEPYYIVNNNLQWSDELERIITITGGTDATNATLIAWLEENATQIIEALEISSIQMPDGGIYNIKDTEAREAISNLPKPMVFKGSVGTGGTITWANLPAASSSEGFTYKVITAHNSTPICKVGDTIISNGSSWVVIPSGDEPSGTVTSVGAQGASDSHVSVSGSPITSSGTLIIDVDSGYSIPSNTDQSTWSGKQDALVSGTNIKTINNTSLLGSGNISVMGSTMCYEEEGNWIAFRWAGVLQTLNYIKGWDGTIEYSTDTINWNIWDGSTEIVADDVIYLRGYGNSYITGSNGQVCWILNDNHSDEPVTCSGNIENLLDWQTVARGHHPEMAEKCYMSMFLNCKSLVTPPELPATTLSNNCYSNMFAGCSSLIKAPDLPATTLANNCYNGMFRDCSSLIKAPDLPATILTESCYQDMFDSCAALITPPELPATTLASYCYRGMFNKCASLTTTPALPATTLATQCYRRMFGMCTALETLPELPATALSNMCYDNMFGACSKIKLSTTQTGEYQTAYRIPTTGTGTDAETNGLYNMFTNTGGTFTGTPSINTTYYTSNTIIPAGN